MGELSALRWRDLDLATGRISVVTAKTDAGERTVDLTPDLRDELATHRAKAANADDPGGYVFATAQGKPQNRNNIRQRVLLRAVERVNDQRRQDGKPLLPDGLSPHSLRRTYASLSFVAGATVPHVMAQLGHTDPKMTLGIYAQVIADENDTGERMDALIRGPVGAQSGTIEELEAVPAPDPRAAAHP